MKNLSKVLFVLFAVAFLSASTFAQTFSKGDKIGQVGIGYGFAGIYGDATIPPISVGLQFGINEKISVGGILGYTSSTYGLPGWEWTYSYILVGARGEYHFLDALEKTDLYAGATLGYNIVSYDEPAGYNGWYSASGSYALFGFHGGARYYVSPQFAIFGELGYGVGYITAGVAYKF